LFELLHKDHPSISISEFYQVFNNERRVAISLKDDIIKKISSKKSINLEEVIKERKAEINLLVDKKVDKLIEELEKMRSQIKEDYINITKRNFDDLQEIQNLLKEQPTKQRLIEKGINKAIEQGNVHDILQLKAALKECTK